MISKDSELLFPKALPITGKIEGRDLEEKALLEASQSGKVVCSTSDMFEKEPPSSPGVTSSTFQYSSYCNHENVHIFQHRTPGKRSNGA